MRTIQQAIALVVCAVFADVSIAAESQASYTVKYSGGSLPTVKGGEDLKLFIDQDRIRLNKNKTESISIPPSNAVTEISYGQEVHRRIGTAAGLAVVSLGIGALVAFSKSKKHYVGIVWDGGDGKKGGVVLQADKNEYRGLIAGLEGVSGKKAIDTDAQTEAAAKSGVPKPVSATPAPPAPPTSSAPAIAATPSVSSPTPQTASTLTEAPRVIPVTTTPAAKVSRQSDPAPSPSSPHAEPARIIAGNSPVAPPVVSKPQAPAEVTFASNPPGAHVSCLTERNTVEPHS